jgi:3-phosphoshikimate 1-carboxyvinyltransferase
VSAARRALEIEPVPGPLQATVAVPGSKSLTNRALVIAALADGEVAVRGALESDDTRWMVEALRVLGFAVDWDRAARTIRVAGRGGEIPAARSDLFGGNAGTVVRFLTSLVALGTGVHRVDGDDRMRERPIGDLLDGLAALGVRARSEEGRPPIVVEARGIEGGSATVEGDVEPVCELDPPRRSLRAPRRRALDPRRARRRAVRRDDDRHDEARRRGGRA